MFLCQGEKYKRVVNGHLRVSNHIHGTAERPRLNVICTSDSNIYVQIIDDEKGVTLTAASSLDKFFEYIPQKYSNAAKIVGAVIAKKALAAGINEVVLDADAYTWHWREFALLLTAAREGGLKILSKGGHEYCLEMK